MGIVLETAKQHKLPLPAATLVTLHMDEVIKKGDGELDSSAVFKVLKKS
jgi:3-hydroxyisobutyrate dehydrogenase-like beta-hydroxyacid dehydrogenase